MNFSNKSREQLAKEVFELRRQNQALLAQLAFHQKVFKEVHNVLDIVPIEAENQQKKDNFQHLVIENERLRYQVKLLRLSNREREVLDCIIEGLTSKDIAVELKISKLTVDTHRKHIQQKLGVKNQVELIKLALMGAA